MKPLRVASLHGQQGAGLPVLQGAHVHVVLTAVQAQVDPLGEEAHHMPEDHAALRVTGCRDHNFGVRLHQRPIGVERRATYPGYQAGLPAAAPERECGLADARCEGAAKKPALPRQDLEQIARMSALADGQPGEVGGDPVRKGLFHRALAVRF